MAVLGLRCCPVLLMLRRAGAALYLQRTAAHWDGVGRGSRAHRPQELWPEAQSPCATWGPPGSGVEPTWPALAGWFLTTGPPAKSSANWSSLNSTLSLACPAVWHEAGLCKPFSFGILGIPSRGPWMSKGREVEPQCRCGMWEASKGCWSVKFMAWRADDISKQKLRIYGPNEVECSESGMSQKIWEMMSPICWVVGAQSTTSALYSGADMQLHSFPPENKTRLARFLKTLLTSTLVECTRVKNRN